MDEVDEATESVNVSLSAPKSMVLFETALEDHGVSTSATVNTGCCNRAGEQEEVRATIATDVCSVVDTSREVQGVIVCSAKDETAGKFSTEGN